MLKCKLQGEAGGVDCSVEDMLLTGRIPLCWVECGRDEQSKL